MSNYSDYVVTEAEIDGLNDTYATDSELVVVSGALQSNINDLDSSLTAAIVWEVVDTPSEQIRPKAEHQGKAIYTAGNLTVGGDLTVSGTTTTVNSQELTVTDKTITVNDGEVGAGLTGSQYAGIEVDRGSETNYMLVFDEVQDNFRVGISGSLQAVATREDTPNDGYVAVWNASAVRFDTTVPITSLVSSGAKEDYIFVPIEWSSDGVTATAAAAEEFVSSNGKLYARKFSGTVTQDVIIPLEIPEDIVVASGIRFKVLCLVTEATGMSNEGIAFKLSGYSIGDGDSINGTFGTAVEATATGKTISQYKRVVTSWSNVVTITDLAAGELAMLKLIREHTNAADTYAQLLGVAGVLIKIYRYLV